MQSHNPGSASNVPLTDGSSRIVTNVSSQRFATNATSLGTTITFGRAPPNVTISNCVPPPLTKIATEGSSSHVTTTTNVTVEPHSQLAIHAVSAVQTASSVSVPAPFSSGSLHVPPVSRPSFSTATAGQMPVGTGYKPATSPPVFPRQVLSTNPGGVIRHPGVHPNPPGNASPIQVKPSSGTTPPPPPLVPNARVTPQGVRPQGMYVPAQSSSSSSISQPRPVLHSHQSPYSPIAARSGVVNHHPQGTAPPLLSKSSGVTSATPQAGMVARGVAQPGAPPVSQRPIMPNYHGVPRSRNPPQNAPPNMRFSSVRAPLGGGFARHPLPMRPQGNAVGAQQQVRLSFSQRQKKQRMLIP